MDDRNQTAGVVLLAITDAALARELASSLSALGASVESVGGGKDAVHRIEEGGVELVFLDAAMPSIEGVACCRLLKTMSREAFLPVVIVLSRSDHDAPSSAVRGGADDYLRVPIDDRALRQRVSAMRKLRSAHEELLRIRLELERQVSYDEGTGLLRFRMLHDRLLQEFKRAESALDPLACLLGSLDVWGPNADAPASESAPEVIKELAQRARQVAKETASIVRYGANTLLFLLPHTQFAEAVVTAERFRHEVESKPFGGLTGPISMTVSMGVALYPSREVRTPEKLLRGAEVALQQARESGRNRVCVFRHPGYVFRPEEGL